MVIMSSNQLCVSTAEAAKMLSISVSKLRQMTHNKTIPHIRCGRRVLYPVSGIEDWLAQNTIVQTQDGEIDEQ